MPEIGEVHRPHDRARGHLLDTVDLAYFSGLTSVVGLETRGNEALLSDSLLMRRANKAALPEGVAVVHFNANLSEPNVNARLEASSLQSMSSVATQGAIVSATTRTAMEPRRLANLHARSKDQEIERSKRSKRSKRSQVGRPVS